MSHAWDPMTPTAYLERAAEAHGDRVAVVDGAARWTYVELRDRAMRLAGALRDVARGRPVAVLAPNTHELLEAHFGVPWAGVPLVAMNSRLGPREMAYILEHSEASVLIHDVAWTERVAEACSMLPDPPLLIVSGEPGGEYERFVADGRPHRTGVEDETSLLSINYTSGTTGRPKGVMYHHRGAYLQALAMVAHTQMDPSTVHLWTLPMFHCNGWCFPWAVTAAGGTHVCLPAVDPGEIWRLVRAEGVTHLNGAPTVLEMIANAPEAGPTGRAVRVATGGAPPSPALLRRMDSLGFEVTHLYGLTESFGPAMICDWRPEWNDLSSEQAARIRARQGVGNLIAVPPRVVMPDGTDAPADGVTTGEIALRGNNVMLGYLKDPEATAEAVPDGWFRTGDLAVRHPDGYIELRDRSKDVIISGGENIASVEVEQVIAELAAVAEVAVVGLPNDRWGEVPVAFVTVREGHDLDAETVVAHVRRHLAHFKTPRRVLFGPLPKTSTGKIRKHVLRADRQDASRPQDDQPS
ncbi:MAG: acyl-CoA synthetase [Marmoricola sp.]|nr:acyl-CoA synthetase [Marmoricola sp.]